MSTVYNLNASACPVVIAPSAQTQISPGTTAPNVSSQLVPNTNTLSAPFNNNAARLDLGGRFGGGTYGIVKGLTLSQTTSGKVDVAAGQAMLDQIVDNPSTAQKSLTLSQNNWVFLLQSGAFSVIASAGAPALPASVCAYLGMVAVDGSGNFTNVDLSGVMYLRGGVGYRKVADTGMPGDTPPSGYIFLTETGHSRYLWDGGAYFEITDGRRSDFQSLTAMTDANYTPASAVYTARILSVPSSLTLTADRDLVLPNIPGWEWTIVNNSTGGFNVKPKVSGQTGITVGNAKTARCYCNGVDIKRLTADV
jgi:hypothetical protein